MGPGVWKPPIGHLFEKLNFEKYINGGKGTYISANLTLD